MKKSPLLSVLLSFAIMFVVTSTNAATWTTINGRVLTQTGTPVCAMVLANGQHMFSCDGAGNYTLNVPLDSNDRITLQVFASGFAPYRQTLTAGQAIGFNVSMERDTTGRAFTITHNESPASRPGWVLVTGNINDSGTPLCAMILINGQSMFSCNQSLGQYSLEVPRDSNGKITLQAFAAGFMPHRDTFGVNDPPIATGQCDSTFQADTYSGVLNATDPEATPLTYALIDPADGTSAGNGPITTTKGGSVEITNPTTGDFVYQPNQTAGVNRGMDTFQYQVTDSGTGKLSDIATETIIVNQTIMPLGDSITAGRISLAVGPPIELRGGYRKPLYDQLRATGYDVDFVGTVDHGQDLPDFDFNHEGHGGWSASDIAWGKAGGYPTDGVRAWLDGNPADVVLLHAGTNGLAPDGSNDIDIEVILDEIDEWEASALGNPVTVILALIVDWDPINLDVAALNSNVLALANDRIANGDDIIIANHHDALNYPDDLGDDIHPNEFGYDKMATVWFDHLTDLLDKCP